ncbi:hypothetical protein MINT15_19870 [Saccharomonospora viridis]|uniref:Uncharacterized protein n=1 Tax=Saccharomonospora viridis TaxID=1852 RepID=A0A837DD17_9PSEU|nr:hypothetical protein MINT15_19870 [Saccharomonospora viridis]
MSGSERGAIANPESSSGYREGDGRVSIAVNANAQARILRSGTVATGK